MRDKDILPLSAVELGSAERDAKRIAWDRDAGPNGSAWAIAFLRLLALHRAVERQSVMLQGQVGQVQSEVESLEAENARLRADNAHLREEKKVIWAQLNGAEA